VFSSIYNVSWGLYAAYPRKVRAGSALAVNLLLPAYSYYIAETEALIALAGSVVTRLTKTNR
jgi:hypothetical protein